MKFRCDKNKLMEITSVVQKAIPAKTTMPVLECIKIDAFPEGYVIFTGNNMELCIEYKCEMQVFEGGTIALASKMFCEIVRKLPDGIVDVTVNEENNITKIQCGISEFNIQGIVAGEFPDPPVLEEQYRFSLKQVDLKRIIRRTLPFTAVTEGKRPALTGNLYEISNGVLKVAASDAHRLAVVNIGLENVSGDYKVIIPGATLRELSKILKDDEEKITVIAAERYVMLQFPEFKVYSRLVEGEFIKYEAILNASNTMRLYADTRLLRESLERALLLINDDSSGSESKVPVRLNIGFDKVEVSCMTGKGKVNDAVDVRIEGDGQLSIGFNCRFLLDALACCEEEFVKIELSTPTSGCFIRSLNEEEREKYTFMVLPVRLYN